MYVMVLDSDVTIEVKPDRSEISRYIVKKTWLSDESVKDTVRPASVDIEIYYEGEEDPIYTETLSGDGDWCFKWSADPDRNDPSKWYVIEKMTDADKEHYAVVKDVSYVEGTDEEGCGYITLTNKYKEPEEPPKEPDKPSPNTGDSTRLGLLIGVNAGALLLIILLVVLRRRNRDDGGAE